MEFRDSMECMLFLLCTYQLGMQPSASMTSYISFHTKSITAARAHSL